MTTSDPNTIKRLTGAARNLLIVAAIGAAVALYQWVQIHQLRTTGATPVCDVSENVSCVAIWNSPLSIQLQEITGIPFPGWGLAWVLVIAFSAFLIFVGSNRSGTGNLVRAVRLTTAVGALVAVALLLYSVTLGVFCPTCVAFYVVVAVAAYLAFFRLPALSGDYVMGGVAAVGILAVCVLLLIYPGLKTPVRPVAEQALPGAPVLQPEAGTEDLAQDPVAQFIQSLAPPVQQALSDTLDQYRSAEPHEQPVVPERITRGQPGNPVHLVEWIEIQCPHCRNLHAALEEIAGIVPPDQLWVQETRYYPLDAQCNPNIQQSDSSGVSCLAAKMLICLAGTPAESQVRAQFFQEQRSLSTEQLWAIAANAQPRDQLQACVDSPQTAEALAQDIRQAENYGIRGTPMAVINGRQAPALPVLIYTLLLTGGDANHPAFSFLPPPNPPQEEPH